MALANISSRVHMRRIVAHMGMSRPVRPANPLFGETPLRGLANAVQPRCGDDAPYEGS
jgi:hypothetical protein